VREIRVINRRLAVCAEISRVVAQFAQKLFQLHLHLEAAVVRSDCDCLYGARASF
jgi:hypothetical protein